jgi:hypothetical protein
MHVEEYFEAIRCRKIVRGEQTMNLIPAQNYSTQANEPAASRSKFHLDIRRLLEIILIAAAVILLLNAAAISRDYQDSWTLEGLEIPFGFFVGIYVLTFFVEKKVSSMLILAVMGRLVFLLIPNLKYVWFQGPYVDQQLQYVLANYVYTHGHIATIGPYAVSYYDTTPLIHLSLSTFSIVLGVPVVDAMKYVPVLLSSLYPLLTYIIVKNIKFLNKITTMKFALFLSSIPILTEDYMVTGSQFGVLLAFFAITLLIMLIVKSDRRYWALFTFSVVALAMMHSSSSVLLSLFLLVGFLVQKAHLYRVPSFPTMSAVFAALSICAAWLMFPANYTFEAIVGVGIAAFRLGGTTPSTESVPPRLFELAEKSLLEAGKVVLVTYGAETFVLILMIVSLLVLLKLRNQLDNHARFLFLIGGLIIVSIPIGFFLQAGEFRMAHMAIPFCPIFIGVLASYLVKDKSRKRTVLLSFMILLTIVLAIPELYIYQPLVPSASVLLKNISPSTPIAYFGSVNSIYQREMIQFAQNHVVGVIACDAMTYNQIIGLTSLNFSSTYLSSYYPLDNNELPLPYSCFLIHTPGVSGGFVAEKAEIRTTALILSAIYNSSVVYTNGESYILTGNLTGP